MSVEMSDHRPIPIWSGQGGTEFAPGRTSCVSCREDCTQHRPCYCCLTAECVALRATVAALREAADPGDMEMTLVASGYATRGWTALEVACVVRAQILRALDGDTDA